MAYVLKIEGIVRIPLSGKVRFPFRLRKRELPRENTPVADGATDDSVRARGGGALRARGARVRSAPRTPTHRLPRAAAPRARRSPLRPRWPLSRGRRRSRRR